MTTKAVAVTGPSILLLGLLTAIDAMSIDGYLPALPIIAQEFGKTPSAVQATFAVFLIGIAVGQAIWGPISDAVGRRGPLLAGLALYCLSSLAAAVAASLEMLIAARLGQALGASAGLVLARAIISDCWPTQEASRLYTVMMQVLGVTAIISPLMGAAMLVYFDWRSIFMALLVMGTATAIWSALGIAESLPPENRAQAEGGRRANPLARMIAGYAALLRTPSFLLAALGCGMATAAMFATLAGMPFLFQSTYGWSTIGFSVLYGASSLTFIVVCEINGRLLSRFGDKRLLMFGLIVQIALSAAMVALVLIDSAGALPFAILWTLLMANLGFTLGNATSLCMRLAPAGTAGAASGMIGVVQFALSAIVAPFTVAGADVAFSLSATTAACALVAAAAVAFALTQRPALEVSGG